MENDVDDILCFSIIIPFFSSDDALERTIESVRLQDYPNLELVLIHRGDHGQPLKISNNHQYSYSRISDERQVAAILEGIKIAKGQILNFLFPGESLLPNSLSAVAEKFKRFHPIDVVIGLACVLDNEGKNIGLKYAGCYQTRRRLLEIWRFFPPPLSAVFIDRKVVEGVDFANFNSLDAWLRYELLCQLALKHQIFTYDHPLIAYPLSTDDLLFTISRQEDLGINISRKYWGSPLSLFFWVLRISLVGHKINRIGRGREILRRGREDQRQGNTHIAFLKYSVATILTPEVSFSHLIFPFFREHFIRNKTLRKMFSL